MAQKISRFSDRNIEESGNIKRKIFPEYQGYESCIIEQYRKSLSRLDPDTREYCEGYIRSFTKKNTDEAGLPLLIVSLISLVVLFLRPQMVNHSYAVALHSMMFVVALLLFTAKKLPQIVRAWLIYGILSLTFVFYCYHFTYLLQDSSNPVETVINASLLFMCSAIFLSVFNPFVLTRWNFRLTILTILAGVGFPMYAGAGGIFCILYIVFVSCAAIASMVILDSNVEAALVIKRAVEAEKKVTNFERDHEFEIARKIQVGLMEDTPRTGRIQFSFHQKSFERVGGDWVGVRDLGSDEVVAVVADTTSKGIDAALVVRTVQSLWALAYSKASFDPEVWLQEVNQTLFKLGNEVPQTLSLGLCILNGERLTYWSAGHIPLYIRERVLPDIAGNANSHRRISKREATPEDRIHTISPGGVWLGQSPEMQVAQQTIKFSSRSEIAVALGSDGVFNNGTLYSTEDMQRMFCEIESNPEAFMDAQEVPDDKSLVILTAA